MSPGSQHLLSLGKNNTGVRHPHEGMTGWSSNQMRIWAPVSLGAAQFHSHWEEQCREASSLRPQPGSQLWNTSCPGQNSALCLGMHWSYRISGGGWHSEERAAKYLSIMQNSFCCILRLKWKSISCVRLFVTPWTLIQSTGFSRPEYWSG